jgi:hypothetical protein
MSLAEFTETQSFYLNSILRNSGKTTTPLRRVIYQKLYLEAEEINKMISSLISSIKT